MNNPIFDEKKEVEDSSFIQASNWFEDIVGCREKYFRKNNPEGVIIPLPDGRLGIRNIKTGNITNCGNLIFSKFGDLLRSDLKRNTVLSLSKKAISISKKRDPDGPLLSPHSLSQPNMSPSSLPSLSSLSDISPHVYVPLHILARLTDDPLTICHVDVAQLQAMRANREAVFQVASNFNIMEINSPGDKPDSPWFTEHYCMDKTQGPAASISAGGGAIVRVHAAFYNPKQPVSTWRQTSEHQQNLLSNLKEHFPVKNGFVCLREDGPKFPKLNSKEYDKLLLSTQVCYHKDVQVTSGNRKAELLFRVNDPDQVVDQVMVAAINILQDQLGMMNTTAHRIEDKCRFILDYSYQGTYIGAITHKRSQIFLTLVGGGVFGNKKEWIYDALINAHKKWCSLGQSTITKVTLVLFSPWDLEEELLGKLKQNRIDYVIDAR